MTFFNLLSGIYLHLLKTLHIFSKSLKDLKTAPPWHSSIFFYVLVTKMGPSYADLCWIYWVKQFTGHVSTLVLKYIGNIHGITTCTFGELYVYADVHADVYLFLLHILPSPELYMEYHAPWLKHNLFWTSQKSLIWKTPSIMNLQTLILTYSTALPIPSTTKI